MKSRKWKNKWMKRINYSLILIPIPYAYWSGAVDHHIFRKMESPFSQVLPVGDPKLNDWIYSSKKTSLKIGFFWGGRCVKSEVAGKKVTWHKIRGEGNIRPCRDKFAWTRPGTCTASWSGESSDEKKSRLGEEREWNLHPSILLPVSITVVWLWQQNALIFLSFSSCITSENSVEVWWRIKMNFALNALLSIFGKLLIISTWRILFVNRFGQMEFIYFPFCFGLFRGR